MKPVYLRAGVLGLGGMDNLITSFQDGVRYGLGVRTVNSSWLPGRLTTSLMPDHLMNFICEIEKYHGGNFG